MAVQQTVEATTTHEVKITGLQRRKLLTELRAFEELKSQRDAIDHAIQSHKDAVDKIREQLGEQSFALEGYKVTQVCGVSSKLDKKKLLALGVSMAMMEQATVTTPKRPYLLISVPGEKDMREE